jgi:MFS family permease
VPRRELALLVALGVDNVGSGLFLPLTLVYVTRVAGLPLAVAGTTVAVGTIAGLLVPPVAGRLVDRVGPRPVVIASQVLQALGAGTYLAARGIALVVVAALLLAAGQQLFYSSLFALISDVTADGPKDRPFAVVSMVRAACFGTGSLVGGAILTTVGTTGLIVAVAADAVSFLACAALLATLVRPATRAPAERTGRGGSVLTDRRFLALIGMTGLLGLSVDFFLTGTPVYVLDRLHGPPWLAGTAVAVLTVLTSTGATVALRLTRRLRRTTAIALGAGLVVLWCVVSAAAALVTGPVLPLVGTVTLAVGMLVGGPRTNAMAVAMAPAHVRGRYLAAFQYAFTTAGVLAPAVVALFAVGVWLPWLLVGVAAALAAVGFPWLGRRLPAEVDGP